MPAGLLLALRAGPVLHARLPLRSARDRDRARPDLEARAPHPLRPRPEHRAGAARRAPARRRRRGAARHRHRRRRRRRARGAVARRRRRAARRGARRPPRRGRRCAPAPEADAPAVLVALDVRELLLHGLLTASGWVGDRRRGRRAVADRSRRPGASRRFLPSTEGVWGGLRQRHADPRARRSRLLVAAGGADLPRAVGGVVGDQALRVHADGARRRAVPELRPADAGRPHHPAGAHPEADGVGSAADAAARPRHDHRRHGRVGGRAAHAAGGRTAATCWCRSCRRRASPR